MIEEIRKNLESETDIVREIASHFNRYDDAQEDEKRLIEGAVNSLSESIKILNSSIPELLQDVTVAKKLPSKKKKEGFELIKHKIGSGAEVVLSSKDKARFLRELDIGSKFIKKIKTRSHHENERVIEFKASRGYLKLANRFFLRSASKTAKNESFKDLRGSLRKANIEILFESYIAMIYMTVLISFFVGLLVSVFLIFFNVDFAWPYFSFRDGNYLSVILKVIWIPVAVPIATFFTLYYYPLTEKQSVGNLIDQELPFAVIHMSAITGSGIEPTEIFRIIGLSNEYPYLKKEVRKVLNQINLYGYDLTTALNNAANSAPSEKLSELFSGLSTSITSGANLSDFFEKRAESLLLSYRLERQKYTKLVETFLDIYISIVIAAPMVFLLLVVMMAISGINIGFGPTQMSIIAVAGIAFLNVLFLVFLQMRQPTY